MNDNCQQETAPGTKPSQWRQSIEMTRDWEVSPLGTMINNEIPLSETALLNDGRQLIRHQYLAYHLKEQCLLLR
jgi:hypothetical protein